MLQIFVQSAPKSVSRCTPRRFRREDIPASAFEKGDHQGKIAPRHFASSNKRRLGLRTQTPPSSIDSDRMRRPNAILFLKLSARVLIQRRHGGIEQDCGHLVGQAQRLSFSKIPEVPIRSSNRLSTFFNGTSRAASMTSR